MQKCTFSKKNSIIMIMINSLIFISTAVVAGYGIFHGAGSGQVGSSVIGWGYFIPYTMDSNLLAGISSLILIIFAIRSIASSQNKLPRWAVTFQLMSTTCLCLTMAVAAVFLGPQKAMMGQGYFSMFQGDMFFFHLLNPVLAIISFTCLIRDYAYRFPECILAAVPTILYSFVYLFMVVFLKVWDDFYNFTFGGRYNMVPLVFVVIYALVLFAGCILIRLHNRNNNKSDIHVP